MKTLFSFYFSPVFFTQYLNFTLTCFSKAKISMHFLSFLESFMQCFAQHRFLLSVFVACHLTVATRYVPFCDHEDCY